MVYDGLNPLLDEIANLSRGVALESLSVAGSKIRDSARAEFERSEGHRWFQQILNKSVGKLGNRRIYQSKDSYKLFGLRTSYKTGQLSNPPSMKSFITSYLMDKSLTVVVGGMHPKFKPIIYRDGKVKGTLPSVAGVSKRSHAILHKLNYGEQNEYHRWDEGKESIKQFKNKWKPRHFMGKGYGQAKPAVNEALTKRLLQHVGKAVNRIEIKKRKVI
jgi:hypothetical protein